MAQEQTWTEWFFGSSQKQTQNESFKSPNVSAGSTSTQPSTPGQRPVHGSPYGPYIRTGRGGAGNYTWQSEVDDATPKNNDTEANQPTSLTEQAADAAHIEQHDTEIALRNQREQCADGPQYVRVGRGIVERKDLSTFTADDSSRSPNSGQRISTTTESVRPAYRGRGGAGNYAAAAEVNEIVQRQKDEELRTTTDQRRERITQDVDEALRAPPGVWLGGHKRSPEIDTT